MFGMIPYRNNGRLSKSRDVWSPWTEFDKAIDSLFKGWHLSAFGGCDIMKTDIKETEKEYIVEAELPGFDKNDIKLELNDDMLTIQVQKDEQNNEESDNYIRKETRRSYANRSFHVENIRKDDITAKYENGILRVVLPKDERDDSNKKQIDIE